jgi:hypothetical protein
MAGYVSTPKSRILIAGCRATREAGPFVPSDGVEILEPDWVNPPPAAISRRSVARMAGVAQLLEAITATFGQVLVLGRLVVAGNAAATAANLVGHQGLVWFGFASCLIGVVLHVVWALLLHELLVPVNARVCRIATSVILVGCAVQAVASALYIAPLVLLTSGGSLSPFNASQVQGLAMAMFKLNGIVFNTYLVFFGLWCVLIGYLIFASRFLPRILGVLLAIAGLGWMTYLAPPLASRVFFIVAAASALGEVPLEFWLIVKGVKTPTPREV